MAKSASFTVTRPSTEIARDLPFRSSSHRYTSPAGLRYWMQLWRARSSGAPGGRPLPEIGWRADHRHLHRSHHPNGNHVRRGMLLRTDAGIESLCHDVDGALVDHD